MLRVQIIIARSLCAAMITSYLDGLSPTVNLVIFSVLAMVVWFAGTQLSYIVDAIADKTKMAKAFLGLVILALVTSLPELVTTLVACADNNPSLALNNIFGGIAMQTAILAIADIVVFRSALSSSPRKPTPILEGTCLILILAITLSSSFIGDYHLFAKIGLTSFVLAGLYFLIIRTLRKYEANDVWRLVDLPEKKKIIRDRHKDYEAYTLKFLVVFCIFASITILIAGLILIPTAEILAEQTGLGTSFVGATLLAITTSLPELSTTIAAVRIGAPTMAIANVFGSNLIMIFLLFPGDIFYRKGLLLEKIGLSSQFAISAGIVVTAIYCIGLLVRKKTRITGMGIDSLAVLVFYIFTIYMLYQLR